MDFCPDAPISVSQEEEEEEEEEEVFPTSHSEDAPENGSLSQLLSQQPIEGDENSEWLSVFVEDCLSSSGNYLLAPANQQLITEASAAQNPVETLKPLELQNPENPTKKRRKKPRSIVKFKTHKIPTIFDLGHFVTELNPDPDPPLLHQAHWLADSEPIFPIKWETSAKKDPDEKKLVDVAVELSLSSDHYIEKPKPDKQQKKKVAKIRKCSHCQAEKTPLWRQGPLGKGTLCNACGVRWLKSGKLFPEYRPANSPTFVSDLHSNVLRKVLKMREARQEASGASGS